jgi:hypothetical protein
MDRRIYNRYDHISGFSKIFNDDDGINDSSDNGDNGDNYI